MSRADAAQRILDAAVALGMAEGVTALTLQGVATAAGVSKALILYHFDGKDALLVAVAEALVLRDGDALAGAAASHDALDAWRELAGAAVLRGQRALLAGLLREAALRPRAEALTARRVAAATRVATAMLQAAGLGPRIATPLLGRVLLQHLDGLAVSGSAGGDALDAELDAAALALLGLGR